MTLLQKIKLQIKELPSAQKAKLVDFMLKQEGEVSEAEAEKAWAKEMQARYEKFRKGGGHTYSAEQVLRELRGKGR